MKEREKQKGSVKQDRKKMKWKYGRKNGIEVGRNAVERNRKRRTEESVMKKY